MAGRDDLRSKVQLRLEPAGDKNAVSDRGRTTEEVTYIDQGSFEHVCTRSAAFRDWDGLGPGRRTGSGAGSGTWAPERGEFPGVYRRMREDGSQLPGLQGLHEPG